MKKYILITIVLLITLFLVTEVRAETILTFLAEWVRNEDADETAIKSQYFARIAGKESFCTLSIQLDCDYLGETEKPDGFEFFFPGEDQNGPERIEIQEIEGNLFILVEDNGLVDADLIPFPAQAISQPQIENPKEENPELPEEPEIPEEPEEPEEPDHCDPYGPWGEKGPNGPYKCKGGD